MQRDLKMRGGTFMRTGILTKFNQKKNLWISKKHPLFMENSGFKTLYASALLMHTRLNNNANPLSNLELERLIIRGFQLTSKEMISMITLSKNVEMLVDEIIDALDTQRKKLLFYLDLMNMSISSVEISQEEQKSLDLFAELLSISPVEKEFISQFISASYHKQYEDCIQLFNQMESTGFPITLMDISYYMIEYTYQNRITPKDIYSGTTNYFSGDCLFEGTFYLSANTTIHISNALVKVEGNFVIDNGTLHIENSSIDFSSKKYIHKEDSYNAFLLVKNQGHVQLKNTTLQCAHNGGLLYQSDGISTIEQCTIKNTSMVPAIVSKGHTLSIQHSTFSHCFAKQKGGALFIKNGSAQVQNCIFTDCMAHYGGAIYANDRSMILGCSFEHCYATEYGSAIFYHGEIHSNVEKCNYTNCYPKENAIIQYIGEQLSSYTITKETSFTYSTIFDCPVFIDEFGIFSMEHATLYLHHHLVCYGIINLKKVKVREYHLEERDFFQLKTPKTCHFSNCEFDANGGHGIFYAVRARIRVSNCIFKNTAGGRAIYDAFMPVIDGCIFSYCEEGALYCNAGKITNSTFINCRGRSGAGIIMYGTRGQIENCHFQRCISEYSGGAIDMSGSRHITGCSFDECRPNNIS